MKLTFRRTGGFGNIVVNMAVDSATLVQDKVTELQAMVTKLLPFKQEKVAAKPDMHHYDLHVEDEGKEYSLEATDETANDDMQDLFAFIMQEGNKK